MTVVSRSYQHGDLNLCGFLQSLVHLCGEQGHPEKGLDNLTQCPSSECQPTFQLMSFRNNFIVWENCFMSVNSKVLLSRRWRCPANGVSQGDMICKTTQCNRWTRGLAVLIALLSSNPLTCPWPGSLLIFIILKLLGHVPSKDTFPWRLPSLFCIHGDVAEPWVIPYNMNRTPYAYGSVKLEVKADGSYNAFSISDRKSSNINVREQ